MGGGELREYPLGCSFGVMQGRLSPQTERGYQAFPWDSWEAEFWLCAERGLEHIEWVLDSYNIEENPLLSSPAKVAAIMGESGIRVPSVCADFLMDTPLGSGKESSALFQRLLDVSEQLGIEIVVVPCVDNASVQDSKSLARLDTALDAVEAELHGGTTRLALETDLGPTDFVALLGRHNQDLISANYDSGNSASLGYHMSQELESYGHYVSDIHLKDRKLGAASVPLGTGDADLRQIICFAKQENFDGIVTMQAFRDFHGLEILDEQLAAVRDLIRSSDG